jgi:hypothetical protein
MSRPDDFPSVGWRGPGDPPTADETDVVRLREVTERLRDAVEHGRRIRGLSVQLSAVVFAAFMGTLGLVERVGQPIGASIVVQAVLAVGSVAVGLAAWIRARRERRLQPLIPQPRSEALLAPLTPEERRRLGRQTRGREAVDSESRDRVVLYITLARMTSRVAVPSLICFALWMAASAVWLGWPFFVALGAVTAFGIVVTRIEARRWNRVLAGLDGA